MKRAKRPVAASVLASAMLFAAMVPITAQAAESKLDRPGEIAMIGDAIFARPLLLASTVVGAGLYVVTLPFSLLGGNPGEAAEVLVMNPGKNTFVRCLGCTPAQHESLKAEKEMRNNAKQEQGAVANAQ
ncbi:hypothetical protein Y017_08185 [Alcanivorax sp. 97CO-5]|jgi:hypothetical protein|nr:MULTISPECIES: hypothetical protein [Alcanivorax]EUC70941.1 hypothetical protein Y017_08185 [Alcanivorax sp. 97CO-5]PKG02466.1 hypothetical protein Y019_04000 [Alcanivorax sp. 97CO-6]BAP15483.1 hypothetical protein AS19_26320 [Alcanivorax sp. NBRC 101098]